MELGGERHKTAGNTHGGSKAMARTGCQLRGLL